MLEYCGIFRKNKVKTTANDASAMSLFIRINLNELLACLSIHSCYMLQWPLSSASFIGMQNSKITSKNTFIDKPRAINSKSANRCVVLHVTLSLLIRIRNIFYGYDVKEQQ